MGILEPIPPHEDLDRTAFVGFGVAQRLLQGGESPTEVHVRTDPDHVTEVRGLLAGTANPEDPQEVVVSRPSDALAARAARGWQLVIPPAAVAGGIAAAVVIGATAGLYPAMRAARLAPTEALRTV